MNAQRYVLKPSTTKAVLGSTFTITLAPVGGSEEKADAPRDENSNVEIARGKEAEREKEKSDVEAAEFEGNFLTLFKSVAGDDQEVDAFELQDFLGRLFKRDFGHVMEFSLECCRSMVVMADEDRSGKLTFGQFKSLFLWMMDVRKIYQGYQSNRSWDMDAGDMKDALRNKLGYEVKPETLDTLVKRFYNKEKRVDFDDFLQISCRLCSCSDMYAEYRTVGDSFDDFAMHMIYT